MKALIAMIFAASFLSILGCDEEKQAPGNSAQPARTPSASAADATASSANAPQLLSDIRAAAAPSSGPENDPGRVTFDGDKTQARSLTVPGAVLGATTAPGSRPKAAYTAPGKGNTLTVNEPPPVGSSAKPKPFSIASALGVSDSAAKRDGSGGGADGGGVDIITGASTDGRTPQSCPQGMALVEGYCIDKYEGSLELDGKPWPGNAKLEPAKTYKALSQAGVKPQAYISGDQAAAACSAAGKRLCSVKEWVKACQGPVKTQYPYGAAYEPGACNEFDHKDHTGHRSAMHRLFGEDAPYTYGPMNDPRLDQMPETVAPSGSFAKCTNGYGVYDMVGNVHEWVADKVGANGLFKGGYFEDTHLNGDGCRYTTSAHATSYHDYSTGFRCCADPS